MVASLVAGLAGGVLFVGGTLLPMAETDLALLAGLLVSFIVAPTVLIVVYGRLKPRMSFTVFEDEARTIASFFVEADADDRTQYVVREATKEGEEGAVLGSVRGKVSWIHGHYVLEDADSNASRLSMKDGGSILIAHLFSFLIFPAFMNPPGFALLAEGERVGFYRRNTSIAFRLFATQPVTVAVDEDWSGTTDERLLVASWLRLYVADKKV